MVCSKAERVMAAPHFKSPPLGLGLWVTWVPGYTDLGFEKRFHKGHKWVLFLAQDRVDWHSVRVLSNGGGNSRVSLSRGPGTWYGL